MTSSTGCPVWRVHQTGQERPTGPWSRSGTLTVSGALIGLPAFFPAAPQWQYPEEECSSRRARR